MGSDRSGREGTTLAGNFGAPKGIQIPQATRDFRGSCVVNCDDYLRMEKHGGIDHCGVLIYPDCGITTGDTYIIWNITKE